MPRVIYGDHDRHSPWTRLQREAMAKAGVEPVKLADLSPFDGNVFLAEYRERMARLAGVPVPEPHGQASEDGLSLAGAEPEVIPPRPKRRGIADMLRDRRRK